MSFHIYQIAITLIAAFMIFQGVMRYIKGKSGQTLLKISVRLLVWGGMAIIALFPNMTNSFANLIGMEGNINAIILTAFLLIFLMIFKLLSAIEKIERQISEITRTDALKTMSDDRNS